MAVNGIYEPISDHAGPRREEEWLPGSPEALPDVLRAHRSIRAFAPQPIDPAVVSEVCDDAVQGASSSGNLNSISIVLTRDDARKRKLHELHRSQPMVLQAPLLMTFCADLYRTRQWLKMRGARDGFDNLHGYHVGAVDAIIVAQNVALGFEARGLGICYLGTTISSMREIAEFLELPETCVPVTSLVVGHPAENPAKRDRLPLRALVHDEKYSAPDVKSLAAIYAEREDRGWKRYMAVPRLRAAIERLGIRSLAEFYTSPAKYDPDRLTDNARNICETLRDRHLMR